MPRLLFISSRNFVWLLFESGYYLRAAFIKLSGIDKLAVIKLSNFSTYLMIIGRAEASPPLSVQFCRIFAIFIRLFIYIFQAVHLARAVDTQ